MDLCVLLAICHYVPDMLLYQKYYFGFVWNVVLCPGLATIGSTNCLQKYHKMGTVLFL